MPNIRSTGLALLAAALALAPSAAAQVRLNGYFSVDYLQGGSDGPWAKGTAEKAQAGLILAGEWSPQFGYTLELRTRENRTFEIEQAWAGWTWSNEFRVKAGVFLVPFGKYNESDRPFQTLLVEAPTIYAESHPPNWREVGLEVEGSLLGFRYAAYIGNGLAESESLRAGQQFADNNKNKGWGGRLSTSLGQAFEAGVSYYRGKADAENARALTLLGADLGWSTENIHCLAEYTRADIDNPPDFSRGRAEGWFVLLGLNFSPIEPVLSYQTSKISDPFHGLGWTGTTGPGAGLDGDHNRWTVGLNYSLHTNILLKLEYDILKDKKAASTDKVLRVQAAVHF